MSNVIQFPNRNAHGWGEMQLTISETLESQGFDSTSVQLVLHNTRPLYEILHTTIELPAELSPTARAHIEAAIRNHCSDIFAERINRELAAI